MKNFISSKKTVTLMLTLMLITSPAMGATAKNQLIDASQIVGSLGVLVASIAYTVAYSYEDEEDCLNDLLYTTGRRSGTKRAATEPEAAQCNKDGKKYDKAMEVALGGVYTAGGGLVGLAASEIIPEGSNLHLQASAVSYEFSAEEGASFVYDSPDFSGVSFSYKPNQGSRSHFSLVKIWEF